MSREISSSALCKEGLLSTQEVFFSPWDLSDLWHWSSSEISHWEGLTPILPLFQLNLIFIFFSFLHLSAVRKPNQKDKLFSCLNCTGRFLKDKSIQLHFQAFPVQPGNHIWDFLKSCWCFEGRKMDGVVFVGLAACNRLHFRSLQVLLWILAWWC